MRYGQRGGYTPAEQQRRERLRLEAAGRFACADGVNEIARDLRVTPGSVRRWQRAWASGGVEALRSKGPVSREKLSPQQWARLEAELRKGPLAHGFADDQRWTLVRIKTLIGRLFHVGYTPEGASKLIRRHGWSCQVPVRQAMERDEAAVAVWKAEVWPEIKSTARDLDAYVCFEDEAGQGLRPPKGRTWAPRGTRPIVRVHGAGGGRVSIAGVVCYRPGDRPRLFYQLLICRRRKGEPKGFAWSDYRDLIITTHRQLGAPLVWCWDNLNIHLAPGLAEFAIENKDWLRIYRLPAYAPDLNPAEGIWSLLKRSMANFAAPGLDHLVRLVKRKLKKIQYRPHLIDGCLATSGLTLEPW
jgi:transposase